MIAVHVMISIFYSERAIYWQHARSRFSYCREGCFCWMRLVVFDELRQPFHSE